MRQHCHIALAGATDRLANRTFADFRVRSLLVW